jgi:hypothetical protein
MQVFKVIRRPAGPFEMDRRIRDVLPPRRCPPPVEPRENPTPVPPPPAGDHPRVGLIIRRKREPPRSRRSRRGIPATGPPEALVLFSRWREALEAGRFDDAMSALDGLRQLSQRPDR